MSSGVKCIPSDVVIKSISGAFVCENGGCSSSPNPAAVSLFRNVPKIYQFFAEVFGLCGIDGKGHIPEFRIGWNEQNAAWNCDIVGLCTFKFHDAYALKPAVIAHEYSHAVFKNRLRYLGESGALDEHQANVFAVAFNQWVTRNTNDWSVDTLYDISQHFDKNSFKKGTFDHGFVHDNSQIPSHAFYCAVVETNTPAYGIIAKIWFQTMKGVDFDETFSGFALKTIAQAVTLASKKTVGAIANSWVHVGVLVFTPPQPIGSGKNRYH